MSTSISAMTMLAACSLAAATSAARATETVFTVLPKDSTVSTTMTTSTPLEGTLIGNYDATTNPTGTKTLPGLFGGSTNTPIPYTATIAIGGGVDTAVAGSFSLIDGFGGPVIEGLSLVHAQANPGAVDLTLTINYQTFRTVNPTGLFLGGIDLPLPLGSVDVSAFAITQESPVPVLVTTQPDGASQLSALVPVTVTIEASMVGAPVDLAPFPAVLPLTGTLSDGPGGPVVTLTAAQQESSVVPATGEGFVDQPMDIPTIIPAGGTAHLLMSGVPGDTTLTIGMAVSIVASGEVAGVTGDINGDGEVDGGDLTLLLGAWGSADASADLDGNGVVSASDLTVILSNWS